MPLNIELDPDEQCNPDADTLAAIGLEWADPPLSLVLEPLALCWQNPFVLRSSGRRAPKGVCVEKGRS